MAKNHDLISGGPSKRNMHIIGRMFDDQTVLQVSYSYMRER